MTDVNSIKLRLAVQNCGDWYNLYLAHGSFAVLCAQRRDTRINISTASSNASIDNSYLKDKANIINKIIGIEQSAKTYPEQALWKTTNKKCDRTKVFLDSPD